MTRVRILQQAIKLLEAGFLPYGGQIATDNVGHPVSYMHPYAVNFTVVGAVQRAILLTTGDHYNDRIPLYNAAFDPIIEKLGGILKASQWFETATQEEIITLLKQQLSEW